MKKLGVRRTVLPIFLLLFLFCLVTATTTIPPLYATPVLEKSKAAAEHVAELEEDSKRMEYHLAELTRLATKQLLRNTYYRQLPHTAAEARWLGNALHRMMQQQQQERGLRMSMGVGVDIEGRADLKNASAFVWTPERGREGLLNATTLLYQAAAKKRDGGETPPMVEEARILDSGSFSSPRIEKRSPRRGGGGGMGGGGGRGASGARGGGGGRMSGGGFRGRGSSSASVFSASSAAGMGRVQPIWTIYAGGTVKSGRTAWDAVDEEAYKVLNSNETRVEVWICYGPHNGNESCSSKVDLLMEKIQIQRDQQSFFERFLRDLDNPIFLCMLILGLASFLLCIVSSVCLIIQSYYSSSASSERAAAASGWRNNYTPPSRYSPAPRVATPPAPRHGLTKTSMAVHQ